MELYDRIVDPKLSVRRLTICASHVIGEAKAARKQWYEQMDLFADNAESAAEEHMLDREKLRQKTILKLQKRYGKNVILKGMNLQEGATAVQRNRQIGGHRA